MTRVERRREARTAARGASALMRPGQRLVVVDVSVSGSVMVVFPVLMGAVGAVLKDVVVSLHGVGNGESESVAGLPSVDESTPDGTGK